MRFRIGCIGKTLLLLLCVMNVPKESLMLEGKKGVCVWMILMTTTRMTLKMRRIKLHLNNEGMFVLRGERRGRGFQRDPRWQGD